MTIELEYGQCFHCNRIVPKKYLTQIRFFVSHLIDGKFHHKTMCISCKEAADEIYDSK